MTDLPHDAAERGSLFPWAIRLGWIGVYLSCMAMADWDFMGPVERAKDAGAGWFAWMFFGSPGDAIVNLHGAAVPRLMGDDAWYRLFLDGWIEPSLLGLVFTIWIWSNLGVRLYRVSGTARSWIVLVLGMVAAAGAHVVMNRTAGIAGAGAGGAIYAALGALTVFAFASRTPIALATRGLVIRYIVMFTVLTIVFSFLIHGDAFSLGTFTWPAMVAGFIAGALPMFAFGPGTIISAPSGVLARAFGLLLLTILLGAAVKQAPTIIEGLARIKRVQDFQRRVVAVERAAWRVKNPRHATPEQRQAVATALIEVRRLEWLTDWEDRDALEDWLECFEPYATGNIPDPDGHVRILIPRVWASYLPVESRLLREVGIAPRKDTLWVDRF